MFETEAREEKKEQQATERDIEYRYKQHNMTDDELHLPNLPDYGDLSDGAVDENSNDENGDQSAENTQLETVVIEPILPKKWGRKPKECPLLEEQAPSSTVVRRKRMSRAKYLF